jgi:pimeloyl-ACP methyl ester carboxylesterase
MRILRSVLLASALIGGTAAIAATYQPVLTQRAAHQVTFGTVKVGDLTIAYREAGDPRSPKLVLLHGWPASSHQFRDLIPALSSRFHVIAPDYQGFGNSDAPDPAAYAYTFDAIAKTMEGFLAVKGFDHYGLFVQDYGGPVGFRLATAKPAALDWLIVQNANAYEEGFSPAWDGFRNALWKGRTPETEQPLRAFLTHDGIKGAYLAGAGHPELIAPESYELDAANMARPYEQQINMDLFYDYRNNVALYPSWQKFLRERHPQTLILWGERDPFFTPAGGEAFLRDLPNAQIHRLAAGHFVTEDNLDYVARAIVRFYGSHVATAR